MRGGSRRLRHAGGAGGALWRALVLATVGLAIAGCGTLQNLSPDWSQFRLPDSKTFVPTQMSAYSGPVSKSNVPVGPADLADAQGICTGMVPPPGDAPSAQSPDMPAQRGVALEMTECEVVRNMGRPQSIEIGDAGGTRITTMTYTSGEHAGIYRFHRGRLVAIERGAEPPPPPPVAAKKPAKPAKKPPPPPPA